MIRLLPALYFSLASAFTFGQSQPKEPNVLLIMVDDLNDYIGYLGGHPQAQTPHLDALAASGVRFTNAHCNVPICAPSRASMWTGVYPHVSQNYWVSDWTKNKTLKNCQTLGQFLQSNGYRTYGTGKLTHKTHLESWDSFGVENFYGPFAFNGKKPTGHPSVPLPFRDIGPVDGVYASLADVPEVPPTADYPGYHGWMKGKRQPFRYESEDDRDLLNDEEQANWAVERLAEFSKSESDDPFFLAVGFFRPHTPLIAPQRFFDLYPLDELQLPATKENDRVDCHFETILPKWNPKWFNHYQTLSESYEDPIEGIKLHLQAYLACVSFVDEQIGKVTQALDKSAFRENTIVMLVSDHGYHQGEKQFMYKNSPWEESTRIPFIVRAPQYANHAGQEVTHPVSLIDVFPTIADLCGLAGVDNRFNEDGAPLSGHSLRPFLQNPETTDWAGPEVALTVIRTPSSNAKLAPAENSYTVRSTTHRYTHYVSGAEELYDHTQDPNEWTNLADEPASQDKKAQLRAHMEALTGDLSQTTFRSVRAKK